MVTLRPIWYIFHSYFCCHRVCCCRKRCNTCFLCLSTWSRLKPPWTFYFIRMTCTSLISRGAAIQSEFLIQTHFLSCSNPNKWKARQRNPIWRKALKRESRLAALSCTPSPDQISFGQKKVKIWYCKMHIIFFLWNWIRTSWQSSKDATSFGANKEKRKVKFGDVLLFPFHSTVIFFWTSFSALVTQPERLKGAKDEVKRREGPSARSQGPEGP